MTVTGFTWGMVAWWDTFWDKIAEVNKMLEVFLIVLWHSSQSRVNMFTSNK